MMNLLRTTLAVPGLLLLSQTALAQHPSTQLEIEWEVLGSAAGTGNTGAGNQILAPNASFIRLMAKGNPTHAQVWVRFVAQLWINDSFFADEGLTHLQPYLGTAVQGSTPTVGPAMVISDAERDAILDSIWNPASPDPDAVRDSFLPVPLPAAGLPATRAWDPENPNLSTGTQDYWAPLTTHQDSTIVRLRIWLKQRLIDQTAGTPHAMSEQDANAFIETYGASARNHGYGLNMQAFMVWDDDPSSLNTTNGTPGLTGNIVFAGTSTPLQYIVWHVQQDGPEPGKPYPVDGSVAPQNFYPFRHPGQKFNFEMSGLVGPAFALLSVNGNDGNPIPVPVYPGTGLTDAYLYVPTRMPIGFSCTVMGFTADGVSSPTIPLAHRDSFVVW